MTNALVFVCGYTAGLRYGFKYMTCYNFGLHLLGATRGGGSYKYLMKSKSK